MMKRYCTEYYVGPLVYGDTVDAQDWETAQALCDKRRGHCDEVVIGELVAVGDYDAILLGTVEDSPMTIMTASRN
jgi:hypothetical protein